MTFQVIFPDVQHSTICGGERQTMKCEFIEMAEYQSLRWGLLGANVSSGYIQNTNIELSSCAWKFLHCDTSLTKSWYIMFRFKKTCTAIGVDVILSLILLRCLAIRVLNDRKWGVGLLPTGWWWINLNVLSVSLIIFHIFFFGGPTLSKLFLQTISKVVNVKYILLNICIVPSCLPSDWLPSSLSVILFCDLSPSRRRLRAKKFVREREHTWLYTLATSLQSCQPDFLESLRDSQRSVVLREQLRHFKGRTCHFLLSRGASR